MNERARRRWAAAEVKALGPRSISLVARGTGISRRAIRRGLAELRDAANDLPAGRIRAPGAGAIPLIVKDPTLKEDLDRLIDPLTRGDPESPLRWTCKSLRNLAAALRQKGHKVCPQTVAKVLHCLKFSLQGNRKTREGSSHPDRNAQFEHIHQSVTSFLAQGEPAISVDTKKKELVGNYKNGGKEWHPRGSPPCVNIHDFPDPLLGKAAPYGVYDMADDSGWVSVGIDHDTAAFAVESIRRWWTLMGQTKYPQARPLLITADCGGSNGARVRLWKTQLQQLADQTGLAISVCHFPPGTSKWNKIEHRLFSFLSGNWSGAPLTDYQTIVELIAATKTRTGLHVRCELDTNAYPKGVKVTDEEMASLNLTCHSFHREWNYTIHPRLKSEQ